MTSAGGIKGCPCSRGNVNRNEAPPPGRPKARISPPCTATMAWQGEAQPHPLARTGARAAIEFVQDEGFFAKRSAIAAVKGRPRLGSTYTASLRARRDAAMRRKRQLAQRDQVALPEEVFDRALGLCAQVHFTVAQPFEQIVWRKIHELVCAISSTSKSRGRRSSAASRSNSPTSIPR